MLHIHLRLIVFFALFMSVPDHLSSVCFCFMCFCWRLNKWCCGGALGKSGRSFTVPLHPKIALMCDLSDCESTIIVAVASEAGALLKSLPTEPSTQYAGVDIKHHHPASSSGAVRENKPLTNNLRGDTRVIWSKQRVVWKLQLRGDEPAEPARRCCSKEDEDQRMRTSIGRQIVMYDHRCSSSLTDAPQTHSWTSAGCVFPVPMLFPYQPPDADSNIQKVESKVAW